MKNWLYIAPGDKTHDNYTAPVLKAYTRGPKSQSTIHYVAHFSSL